MNSLSYQQCYEILALPNDADWEQADAGFRKLVQHWHPDRYSGDEPEEATRRYIEITKAFKKLREFHKENGAMPFGTVRNDDGSSTIDGLASANDLHAGGGTSGNKDYTNSGRTQATKIQWSNQHKFRISKRNMTFAALSILGIALTLVFMLKLDKINNEKFIDDARLQRISELADEQ